MVEQLKMVFILFLMMGLCVRIYGVVMCVNAMQVDVEASRVSWVWPETPDWVWELSLDPLK